MSDKFLKIKILHLSLLFSLLFYFFISPVVSAQNTDPRYLNCLVQEGDPGYCAANYENYSARASTSGAACTSSANCMDGEVCDISKKICQPLVTPPKACDLQKELENFGCPNDQICNTNTGYCIARSTPATNGNLPPGPSIAPYSGGTPTVPSYIGGNVGTPGPNASWCGNDPNLEYDSAAKMCLPKSDPCTSGSLACSKSLSDLIIKIINYLLIFAGMFAVLAVVVGGFWYITAAGNEEQSEKGKKALINAIIGIVIVSLAFVIVRVISHTLTSGSV